MLISSFLVFVCVSAEGKVRIEEPLTVSPALLADAQAGDEKSRASTTFESNDVVAPLTV
jgi:hypothetical protein